MIEYLILLILGLAVGSFLSVVIYRETAEEKKEEKLKWLPAWVAGRSYCDKCKKKLTWKDNIPLLSYLILGGKCRYCQAKIPPTYPLIEIFTGIEFVWIYWLLGRLSFFQQMEGIYSFAVLGFWIFVFSLSLVLSFIDIKSGILPDNLVLIGTIISFLRLLVTGRWEFLLSGIGLFLFFLFLYLITSGKGIGFGDVKLAFFIGVTLGWWQWTLVSMFFAFLTGAIFGVILIVVKKKTMKSSIPFGPFMLSGMLFAKIFGEYVWNLYISKLM